MRFLQRAHESLRNLLQGLPDRRARPVGTHHHRLDDEGRILAPAEPVIGQHAGHHRDDHEIDNERAMPERPFRQVEAVHGSDPSSRTFCPGCRAWTPAVTMISPVWSALDTTTAACP